MNRVIYVPLCKKTIALIEKNLISPEERYSMIEEYNFEARMAKSQLKTKKEIFNNMIGKGFPMEMVMELTNLTLAEIESLNEEED